MQQISVSINWISPSNTWYSLVWNGLNSLIINLKRIIIYWFTSTSERLLLKSLAMWKKDQVMSRLSYFVKNISNGINLVISNGVNTEIRVSLLMDQKIYIGFQWESFFTQYFSANIQKHLFPHILLNINEVKVIYKGIFVDSVLEATDKRACKYISETSYQKIDRKKDRDKRFKQNWRPILLLNVDLKIISKILSLSLSLSLSLWKTKKSSARITLLSTKNGC